MVSGFLALTFCLLFKTEKNKDGKDRLELDNRVGKTSRQNLPGGAASLSTEFFSIHLMKNSPFRHNSLLDR